MHCGMMCQMQDNVTEFEIIKQICAGKPSRDHRVLIGPGDDLALIQASAPGDSIGSGDRMLLGVDQLVDGLHVDLTQVSLQEAGRKAVCRSLSDVAAMAGRPVATLVSAVVPAEWNDAQAMTLFDAMKSAAEEHHAPLVGGDLAVHGEPGGRLTCSVTVVGVPSETGVVSRFNAEPGDGLYVTGELGGSWQGRHHLDFVPRLAESAMLLAILGNRLHAMIDISDGLGRDAAHMVERSGLQVLIDAESLPCREGFGVMDAVADGEDYELLFAASGDVPEGLGSCAITRIGEFQARDYGSAAPVLLKHGDELRDVSRAGWEHHSK